MHQDLVLSLRTQPSGPSSYHSAELVGGTWLEVTLQIDDPLNFCFQSLEQRLYRCSGNGHFVIAMCSMALRYRLGLPYSNLHNAKGLNTSRKVLKASKGTIHPEYISATACIIRLILQERRY